MPEGPSLVIAGEDLSTYVGRKVRKAQGNAKFNGLLSMASFKGERLHKICTWGKHLLLIFDSFSLRIHFLMFGSYTVENPKDREPRLELQFSPKGKIFFYTCSIKPLEANPSKIYDWSTDLMSDQWSKDVVLKKIKELPKATMVCDALMNQEIFTGLGNIMKNETLYRMRMHPETKLADISSQKMKKLIQEARIYAFDFYRWKKKFVLKKHWEIMRKKTCPKGHSVTRRTTGKGQRLSHYCTICQPLRSITRS